MHFLCPRILAIVRRLLALVSAIIFVDALLFTALTPLVPVYAEEFDLSKAGAGLLVGAYGAGALFGGIPGGLAASRFGPKRAVIGGLILLSVSSFAFAAADSAVALGGARFVQGVASTATWAGALAWISVTAPRERRGEAIGAAFGAAIFGAVLGPAFGGVAELVSVDAAFTIIALVTLAFAGLASLARSAERETASLAGLRRALRDERFLGGLWLNMLPAMLFGLLIVLTPLALDDAGWSTFAIAAVFFGAGLVEVVLNPLLGRYSDRVGRLLPIRVGTHRVGGGRPRARGKLRGRDHRAARLRRRNQLRKPLHAEHVVDVSSGGDGRTGAGPGVRRHEHRVGVRRARRSVGRRRARRLCRRCGAVPRRRGPVRSHTRGDVPGRRTGEATCSVRTGIGATPPSRTSGL